MSEGQELLDEVKKKEEIEKINAELKRINESIESLNAKAGTLIERKSELMRSDKQSEEKKAVSSVKSSGLSGELTLLIVDDDRTTRKLMTKMVDKEKFKIIEASSAMEALELLETNKITLAIVDIFMDEMDGLTFLLKLRERPDTQNIPVIMCTSSDKRAHIAAAARMGVKDYIIKPFNAENVRSRIEKVLDGLYP